MHRLFVVFHGLGVPAGIAALLAQVIPDSLVDQCDVLLQLTRTSECESALVAFVLSGAMLILHVSGEPLVSYCLGGSSIALKEGTEKGARKTIC